MVISRRNVIRLMALILAAMPSGHSLALAAGKVRLGALKFGTVSWELDTIKHHGFDAENGIDLDVAYFAGEDATNVAMLAGGVDIIVTDWLWVSRQRSSGDDVAFVPYSSAVGAIMVKDASPIRTPADLVDRKIGVAGGPLDKSWLLLQALFRRDYGIDLPARNEIVFGAPPLISEKAMQGELDAVLNFGIFAPGSKPMVFAGWSAHRTLQARLVRQARSQPSAMSFMTNGRATIPRPSQAS